MRPMMIGRRNFITLSYRRLASIPIVPGRSVLGRSDRFAAYPADDPYTPQDLAASILRGLGVDPGMEVRDAFGRNVPLSTGQARPALFGSQRSAD